MVYGDLNQNDGIVVYIKWYEFNSHLNLYLVSLDLPTHDYNILIGDIKINIYEWDDSTDDYLNILKEFGNVLMSNTATRNQGKSDSCFNHIFKKH